jgi:hypothetical protein
MKKLFLFIGVILLCLLFSCVKFSSSTTNPPPPPPVIDSFLLHPPPVLDSLPFPLTVGSWWKYQINDSTSGTGPGFSQCCALLSFDSSIEITTIIGKAPYVITVNEIKNNIITRTRYDTVNAFLLEEKNLTKGIIDTNYAYYYNAFFRFSNFSIKVPLVEGSKITYGDNSFSSDYLLKKDTSIIVMNKNFDHCILKEYSYSYSIRGGFGASQTIFLKPDIGFVYMKDSKYQNAYNTPSTQTQWGVMRLKDYHIAP